MCFVVVNRVLEVVRLRELLMLHFYCLLCSILFAFLDLLVDIFVAHLGY
jgi:hypothetical protein